MTLPFIQSSGQIPFTATPVSNLRQKIFKVSADSISIDTVSIVPNTFSVKNVSLGSYRIDLVKAILFWKQKPVSDSITVTYRVFPFQFTASAQHMNSDSVMNMFYIKPFEFNAGLSGEQKGIFDFGTLKAEESFGRQIEFGSNQSGVLNSTLNMQLSGMMGDSIEIQPAITDNNIPIQPDGTIQQLNEFDQVYLQFRKKDWQLSLGDIDIRQNQSYFLNFYKRIQGISFETANRISNNISSKTLVSGSIWKFQPVQASLHGLIIIMMASSN
jgi:hypothetical protein